MIGMTLIVKKVTQFIIGLIFVFGINIVLFGHLTPGGGFAGGVILACGFILIMLAFGKDIALGKVRKPIAHIMDSSGALMFLALAMLGYIGGTFFFNFLPQGKQFYLRSAGFIPLANIAIGIKVSSSLFIAFVALVLFGKRVSKTMDDSDEE
jgi:multicomponent Na+:H+ antiporter subunit B